MVETIEREIGDTTIERDLTIEEIVDAIRSAHPNMIAMLKAVVYEMQLYRGVQGVRVYVRDGVEARAYSDKLTIGPQSFERLP